MKLTWIQSRSTPEKDMNLEMGEMKLWVAVVFFFPFFGK